jgi:hypothetical protein
MIDNKAKDFMSHDYEISRDRKSLGHNNSLEAYVLEGKHSSKLPNIY